MRRAAKVDRNHAEIIAAFRKMGCLVHDTSRLGGGFPDCVVALGKFKHGLTLVEIKDGKLPPSQRKLTATEQRFHDLWGQHVITVTCVYDAIFYCQIMGFAKEVNEKLTA